jgi:predicted ATPase/signal transduction histidine kinase/tRNA A-37 threonylcarbamoyl transferase component Bud32
MPTPEQSEYTLGEHLQQGGGVHLYRALSQSGQRPVILKILDPALCSPRDLERLKNEYELGRSLSGQAVMRPHALETFEGRPALVMEDFAGEPLDRRRAGEPMPVGEFLRFAARTVGDLCELHERGLIHKDLKPANLLYDARSGEVRIAGLGIASRLPHESVSSRPAHLLEGSLPYISPEQTGRMRRVIDSRSDLYSLGVTFYELLTGRLPFYADDALGWVHCHLARRPVPPDQVVRSLPAMLSSIVDKLLAKVPDDRYQSAAGLKHDLERCLAEWDRTQAIEPFALGERDVSAHFFIPQRLYGREVESAALREAFERVATTGAPALVMVSGYSGIGKSTLVQELHKPILGRRGLFISGKFEQYRREIPYYTIVQAFRELVLDILSQSDEQIAGWRKRLHDALGDNARLIVELIPQMGLVLGHLEPLPELPLNEAENRLRRTFGQFFGAFARPEHPLTLFLDDLQWADAASVKLIHDLMSSTDTRHLLLIGAYRDNEVDPSHPLARMLDEVRKSGVVVRDIVVGPLTERCVTELVAETVRCAVDEAEPLARLVRDKTAGNPFFVGQFLGELYRQQLITFDNDRRRWRWDAEKIRAQRFTDNVVELVLGKLRNLAAETRATLALAACLGNLVDAETLALVLGRDPAGPLREALADDLLLAVDGAYRFPHDRVQEAAYALIPEDERASTHLRIGRLLLDKTKPEDLDDQVFDIVSQLERGAPLITSQQERERVAELELRAGKRAKTATAYASALRYFVAGSELLGDEGCQERPALAFQLDFNRAECEYLTGDLTMADERLATLSARTVDRVDAAAVAATRIQVLTTMGRMEQAVAVGLAYLRLDGLDWSPHPTEEEERRAYERLAERLAARPIEALANLPTASDTEALATMNVLSSFFPTTMLTDDRLYALNVYAMVDHSLRHGNSDASPVAYVLLGGLVGPRFNDYGTGFELGMLGVEMVEKRRLLQLVSKVYLSFGSLINQWSRPPRTNLAVMQRAFDAGLQMGDLPFACFSRAQLITSLEAMGAPLDEVQREIERGLDFVRRARFPLVIVHLTVHAQLTRNLRGATAVFGCFDDSEFAESRFEAQLESDPGLAMAACWYWIRKLQARYLAGDCVGAVTAIPAIERLSWSSAPFFEFAEYHFYGALARAARYGEAGPAEREQIRDALTAHQRQLEIWAQHCPESLGDRALLVGAEVARIAGDWPRATQLYEEAIRSARQSGFVHHEGTAYETASRGYRARGFVQFADFYLREARARYQRWGADGKVRQLERLHPQLVEVEPSSDAATVLVSSEQLDLLSVVKASQTISRVIERDELLRTLLQVVIEQGGARRARLIVEREGELTVAAEAAVDEAAAAAPTELPVSILQYVQRTQQRVLIADAQTNPGRFFDDEYLRRVRPRSVLCLPIRRQAEVALLYLDNDLIPDAFTAERLVALDLLASQAAISLENSLLFQERRRAEDQARFLDEASKALTESLDYRTTLARVARLAVPILADWCIVDIVEEGEFRRVASAHVDASKERLLQELAERTRFDAGSPMPAAKVRETRASYVLRDMTAEVIRAHSPCERHAELIHALGTKSMMAIPLVAHGDLLGVMSFVTARPDLRYGPGSVALGEELARRAAVAIENARLYQEAQESIRRRDEFLTAASHELRTPVTSLLIGAQTLIANADSPLEQTRRIADLINRQATRLAKLINDMMSVGRIRLDRLELQLADVDLVAVVRDVAERFAGSLTQNRCALELRADKPVRGRWDREKLDQVVTNLLGNAMKFGAGKPIEVVIDEAAGRARLVMTDHGIGIDAESLQRIFGRFERTEAAHSYGGLGLGLYIARNIVEAHGGTIRAESRLGEDTRFIVELPCEGPTAS